MEIIEGGFGKKACVDLSKNLREIADRVDRGEIKDLVLAYATADFYSFEISTSPVDAVALASLLQSKCVDRMRG